MTISSDIKDREFKKFKETAGGETAVRVEFENDISLGAVEIKDATTDTRAVVKTDGVNNALVVMQNSQPLPTGASTSALQTTGNSSLSSIDGKITACNTGAVTVSSSVLPTNASTSALQTTGNSSLSSIDGKITACNTGAVVVTTMPSVTVTANNLDIRDLTSASDSVSVDSIKSGSAGTSTGVTVGATSTTVLAANSSRKTAIIVNDSTEDVYLKYGSSATMNSGIRINAFGGSLTENTYTGIITAICLSGSKVVTVTEI